MDAYTFIALMLAGAICAALGWAVGSRRKDL